MVSVTAEELSPIVTGLVYCGVILACQEVERVAKHIASRRAAVRAATPLPAAARA